VTVRLTVLLLLGGGGVGHALTLRCPSVMNDAAVGSGPIRAAG
jgi:hypothetical protein